jgi:hypothetical protein
LPVVVRSKVALTAAVLGSLPALSGDVVLQPIDLMSHA